MMRNATEDPAGTPARTDAARGDIADENALAEPIKPRYFERPDQGVQPLSLLGTFKIVLSAHLGVRTMKQRRDDFRRANGLYLFIAGIVYFALLITALIVLVTFLAG